MVSHYQNELCSLLTGQSLLHNQLNWICKENGRIMRSDHTYKISKALSVYNPDTSSMCALSSSTLVIMDENGLIMKTVLCPDDKVSYFGLNCIL